LFSPFVKLVRARGLFTQKRAALKMAQLRAEMQTRPAILKCALPARNSIAQHGDIRFQHVRVRARTAHLVKA